MNSGVKGGGTRVSIPSNVKKTIEDIKEITGNKHSEDDIYAMLKECAMDPNETTQKLLLLDTFHEVKRRRDRKKSSKSSIVMYKYQNKEPEDSKWKPGTQSRSNRIGHANYITRNASQDAGGGRNTSGLKENASSYAGENVNAKVLSAASLEIKNSSSLNEGQTGSLSNGPSGIASHKTGIMNEKPTFSGEFHLSDEYAITGKPNERLPPSSLVGPSNNSDSVDAKNAMENELLQLGNNRDALLSSASGSYLMMSGSQDLPAPDVVSGSKQEQGRKHAIFQLPDNNIPGRKSASGNSSPTEIPILKLPLEMHNYIAGVGESQQLESLPATSLTFEASTVGRPSNNNDRSQVIGQQKSGRLSLLTPVALSVWLQLVCQRVMPYQLITQPDLRATCQAISSEEATHELERKLKNVNLAESKHVVMPKHFQVPDVKKLGFCFGSFDAGFELDMSQGAVGGIDGKTSLLSDPLIPNDEPVKLLKFRGESTIPEVEDTDRGYSEQLETTVQQPPSTTLEPNEPLLEAAQENHQNTPHHVPSSYTVGLMPTVSSQVSPLESLESQARDATQLPGFIMPQSFDPTSYYAHLYRSGFMDNDGRISPILAAGAVNKYTGNNTVFSSQTAQTEFQGNGQLVLSAAPPQLVTQAAGVMRSSIATTQQPLPIFRHPSGAHPPHYPPNFIPYGPYFSPFYVPPSAIHQFLSNGMFPQQPQSGSLYPSAPGTSSKHSVAQFKQGSNPGNSTQIGLPGSYGAYGLSMAGYTSSSPSPTVTSSSNDVASATAPHVKENNAYTGVQQNDGSVVWFTTPVADIGSLQVSTFYNLPQCQMPFNPTGPGHGSATFTGIFHPAQGVAPATNVHPTLQQSQPITNHVDMAGQTANSAYQQTQPNWSSNY